MNPHKAFEMLAVVTRLAAAKRIERWIILNRQAAALTALSPLFSVWLCFQILYKSDIFASRSHMSPKEAPMISLLEDIQNRLDAGGVIVKFNRPRSRNGRALLDGLHLFGSEHTRGLDSPKIGPGASVPVNDGCSLIT
jgi:hypothetical protein